MKNRCSRCTRSTSRVGPPGPPGPSGSSGINGTNGIDGTNGTDGANGPSARIYSATVQDVPPDGDLLPLTFEQPPRFDTGGLYNPAFPTRLTATVAGIYQITGNVLFAPVAQTAPNGNRGLVIRVNGTLVIGGTFGPFAEGDGTPTAFSTTTLYRLDEGDYVELTVNNTNVIATTVIVQPNVSPEFMMVRVDQ